MQKNLRARRNKLAPRAQPFPSREGVNINIQRNMTVLLPSEALKQELKAKLREKGITQKKIAETLGMPPGNVSRALAPHHNISLQLFCSIVEIAELELKLD